MQSAPGETTDTYLLSLAFFPFQKLDPKQVMLLKAFLLYSLPFPPLFLFFTKCSLV